MASEESSGPVPDDAPSEGDRVPRRISRKQLRIIALVSVVAVIVIVLLWGMVPERIYEVRDVYDDIGDLDGEYINVKGVVASWESGDSNYTLADTKDSNLTIEVSHKGAFPEGFGLDVTIVAKGYVRDASGNITMESDVIQIGCPSKY